MTRQKAHCLAGALLMAAVRPACHSMGVPLHYQAAADTHGVSRKEQADRFPSAIAKKLPMAIWPQAKASTSQSRCSKCVPDTTLARKHCTSCSSACTPPPHAAKQGMLSPLSWHLATACAQAAAACCHCFDGRCCRRCGPSTRQRWTPCSQQAAPLRLQLA
jgi:hypothetical protein